MSTSSSSLRLHFLSYRHSSTSQLRPNAALVFGHVPPFAPGGSNVFTTLSLASAYASSTVNASHVVSSAFPQPTSGLLPPPVGLGTLTAPDRMTRDSMFTNQHSDAFNSWSHPASATAAFIGKDCRCCPGRMPLSGRRPLGKLSLDHLSFFTSP